MSPLTIGIALIVFSLITGGILIWSLVTNNEKEHEE